MVSYNCKITFVTTGKPVYGQVGFPSGTTVSCYGNDSICSGTPTNTTLDYGPAGDFDPDNESRRNPCCYDHNDNFDFQPSNYYTVLGSRCQSCSGD